MAKFSLTTLKKELMKKTKKELVEEISELCQRLPQVKDYYRSQGIEAKSVIRKYKAAIRKEFIQRSGKPYPRGRVSEAVKAVNQFRNIAADPEMIADVMLTFVESVSHFCDAYCPDDDEFSDRSIEMFEDTLVLG